MSSNLVRRTTTQPVQPDPILNSQVVTAERVSLGAVARLQGAAYATSVALQNAVMLSKATDAAFKVSPMGEDVYRAIFLAYGSLAATEIQVLGLQNRGH